MPNDEVSDLPTYVQSALAELARTDDEAALESWYRRHLAPSGALNLRKRSIGKLPPEHRREAGQGIHRAEEQIGAAFRSRKEEIRLLALRERLRAASVDVTLPPRALLRGGYHPSTQLRREVGRIFGLLGFVPFESPHVEFDEHNFGLLNMPPDHPARDMQDTFYITDDVLLRTHTMDALVAAARRVVPYREIPRFPAIDIDIAVIAPRPLPAQQLVAVARSCGAPAVQRVVVFDVFESAHPGPDRKGVALRLTLADEARTLEMAEAQAVRERVATALRERLHVEVRE